VSISAPDQPAQERFDASGLLALPGFVDTHVHLMEPTSPEREDWPHGTSAAAASGVTTIIEHTHNAPVRSVDDLVWKLDVAAGRSHVDFGLAAHAWPGFIDQVDALWAAGIAFFKVFTCTTHGVPGFTSDLLLELFEATGPRNIPCLIHCEDEHLTAAAERRLREANRADGGVLVEWRNRAAEQLAVADVALLATITGARAAIAHVSTPAVLDQIRAAQKHGARLVAETCPQYLALFEDEVLEHGSLRKFTPPARGRSQAELDEMWREVARGDVHHISTDHAPSTLEQKSSGSIWDAPFGLPGLDSTSSLLIDAAVHGVLSWERLAELYSSAPARLYGFQHKGGIRPGADADLVLIDPTANRELSNAMVRSLAGWTPYNGRAVKGEVARTYLRGRIDFDGKNVTQPIGKFVPGPGAALPPSNLRGDTRA
jgi:dihydroorotase (multifunctional complex type)